MQGPDDRLIGAEGTKETGVIDELRNPVQMNYFIPLVDTSPAEIGRGVA